MNDLYSPRSRSRSSISFSREDNPSISEKVGTTQKNLRLSQRSEKSAQANREPKTAPENVQLRVESSSESTKTTRTQSEEGEIPKGEVLEDEPKPPPSNGSDVKDIFDTSNCLNSEVFKCKLCNIL